jgi:hypothetical protein
MDLWLENGIWMLMIGDEMMMNMIRGSLVKD